VQGCVSPAVGMIEGDPLVEKQPADLEISGGCGQMQSRLPPIVCCFGISPGEEKKTEQVHPIHHRGVVEGRVAIAILRLHIRSPGDKHFAAHLISRSNRPNQRAGLLFGIPGIDADRIRFKPLKEALQWTESRFGEQIPFGPLPEKIFMDLLVGAPSSVA